MVNNKKCINTQTTSGIQQLQYSSTKKFAGSKPSNFYGEGYFLNSEGSNYGRKDKNGLQLYLTYEEENILPGNRMLAAYLSRTYKPKTAIVLGCARAYLVKAFHELGVECKGVDISEWAINHAPSDIKQHLYVGDICDLSFFESSSFDVTVAMDVFEHIAVPDLFIALDEAKRITREVIVTKIPVNTDDLHPDQTFGGDKSHISVYSVDWWQRQFEDRGFCLEGKSMEPQAEDETSETLVFRKKSALRTHSLTPASAVVAEKQHVNIIMLNWNGLKFTPKCIETLYKNTDYPFNLVVVDNQSTDGSEKYLSSIQHRHPNMHVIFSEHPNSGYAQGVNIGLQYCRDLPSKNQSPYSLLLNNDTLFIQKDWLSILVNALENNPDVGVVSPQLLYPNGRLQCAGATFNAKLQPYHIGRFKKPAAEYLKERAVPWTTFACTLIRSNLLEEGLDESYLLGTYDDVDFCTKARFDGFRVLYVPSASVYHYEGGCVLSMDMQNFGRQQRANVELVASRWADWLKLNMGAYPELYAEQARTS